MTTEISRDFDSGTFHGKQPSVIASEIWQKHLASGTRSPDVLLCLILLLIDTRVREHELYDLIDEASAVDEIKDDLRRCSLSAVGDPYQWAKERIEFFRSLPMPPKVKRVTLKVGDVLAMPIAKDMFAFAHLGRKSAHLGELYWIYGFSSQPDGKMGTLKRLFGPVRFGAHPALRGGIYWRCNAWPDMDYPEPAFLNQLKDKGHRPGDYWLETERGEKNLGKVLPDRFRGLESATIWSLASLEKRIVTGEDPNKVD